MNASRIVFAFAVAAAFVTGANDVVAEPSIWARAKDPQLNREAKAVEAADLAVSRDYSYSRTTMSFRRAISLRRALANLIRQKAHRSVNPDVRFRVAQMHYRLFDIDSDLEHITKATAHFEFVVASDHVPVSQRARALMSLAICYARLGRHGDEVEAYNQAIALQPDPVDHSVLLANQAEGLMARGRIMAAVRGYRASLRATLGPLMLQSGVTTMWGLAVSLDRSGDLDSALENVRRARSYDPGDERLKGPGWFFVPAYDQHWYAALGHWQIARDDKRLLVRQGAYEAAIASWRSYIEQAALDDPWLGIADYRVLQCDKERRAVLERIALERAEAAQRDGQAVRPRAPKDPTLAPQP